MKLMAWFAALSYGTGCLVMFVFLTLINWPPTHWLDFVLLIGGSLAWPFIVWLFFGLRKAGQK